MWKLICEAKERLEGRVRRTPLVEVPAEFLPRGSRLLLKLESRQVSGSFKARGARHYLDRLLEGSPPPGVITYSSGNHGRAVAEAAADRGIPAVVTVPDEIDRSKAEAIERAGALLIRAGPTSTSRYQRALEIAQESHLEIIPPFDHEWILAGQAPVALEILEDCPEMTDLWAPVGGLSGGCAATLIERAPEVRLHAVEPIGAAAYAESVRAGDRVHLRETGSVADGLLPLAIGKRNWSWLRRGAAQPEEVSDQEILRSLRVLREDLEITAEPSGAVAAAPLLVRDPLEPPRTGRVSVAIVSGGNVDPERLAALLASAEGKDH